MGSLNRYLTVATLLLFSSISSITALPNPSEYAVFEKVPLPEEWIADTTPVNPAKTLSMRIHLKQQNTESFEKRFLDLSDPDHADYGNFLTRDQVRVHLAPSESAVSSVKNWLSANGIENFNADYDSITFPATIEEAEKLLHAKYQTYTNSRTGKSVVRTLEYSLPSNLLDKVALIQPTTMFGFHALGKIVHNVRPFEGVATFSSNAAISAQAIDVACNASITPDCLANLYGFKGYKPQGKGKIGVSGFLEQAAQFEDLTKFMTAYKPEGANANFSVVSINGGENPQNPPNKNDVVEANLDIQYAIGIAYPIDTTYYTVGGRPPYKPDLDIVENDSEPYLDYLNYLLAQKDLPDVITTSYGENEQTVPLSYRLTVCEKFKELGARGVSVLFSSGDSGPGWSCRSNDGKNSTKFLPIFPAACPWVTSVGGTIYVEPEQAVDFSSGGFSETWPQPSYQTAAVTSYFLKHPEAWTKWAKYFNIFGRGFPDVAAQGENYRVFVEGTEYLVDGTSASAPAFAAVIALVNDYRISKGKKALGFLNTLLYKNPQAFTDIKAGRSVGCDGTTWGTPIEGNPAIIPGAGWDAVSGWDPVTGLGTPKFEELKKLP